MAAATFTLKKKRGLRPFFSALTAKEYYAEKEDPQPQVV